MNTRMVAKEVSDLINYISKITDELQEERKLNADLEQRIKHLEYALVNGVEKTKMNKLVCAKCNKSIPVSFRDEYDAEYEKGMFCTAAKSLVMEILPCPLGKE